MNIGDRVRVKDSVVFYHHPLHRNQAFDAKGMEGVIVKILSDYQGRPISANFPVHVEFQVEGAKRPFKAHLRKDELEAVES
ncbi:ferredoxin-thioredoxin reductase variable chain [Pseudanabaena sp. FACHB-2040]|uniref:ferredoxin-thioredoxin reductase variable chain n=1 Tax=Pseudanabaena sp. FACHB-2040 TaxID=2692859 RepID=UPI001683CD29|nr:ferredoxin-thioredoxin reductase variable chain [Pseudanabaena sp. FACHB-2040]MBD2258143.1 ferredoxin-thioredoxin reductase variable chain [Pseudanabaena sp. FACHB-2040]